MFAFSFVKIEIGGKNMAKKGQKFKTWTADEKYLTLFLNIFNNNTK